MVRELGSGASARLVVAACETGRHGDGEAGWGGVCEVGRQIVVSTFCYRKMRMKKIWPSEKKSRILCGLSPSASLGLQGCLFKTLKSQGDFKRLIKRVGGRV